MPLLIELHVQHDTWIPVQTLKPGGKPKELLHYSATQNELYFLRCRRDDTRSDIHRVLLEQHQPNYRAPITAIKELHASDPSHEMTISVMPDKHQRFRFTHVDPKDQESDQDDTQQ